MADRRTRVNTKTAATWTSENPVLAEGEVGHESDTGKIKVGDGSTAWSSLSYTSATADTTSATNFTSTLQVNGSDVTTDADIGSTIQAYDANLTGFVAACNLPTSDGTADQVLKTDGAGTISFATQSGGSLSDQGVTASAAELNTLDGITATTAELNYCDGVTSNIQTQLDAKQAADSNLTSFLSVADLPTSDGTSGQVLSTDGSGNLSWTSAGGGSSSDGVSGAIQYSDGSGGFNSDNTDLRFTGGNTLVATHVDTSSLRYSDLNSISLQNTFRAPDIQITFYDNSYTKSNDSLITFTGNITSSGLKTKGTQFYGIVYAAGEDQAGAKGFDLATYDGGTLSTGKVIKRYETVSVSGAGTFVFDADHGYHFLVNEPGGDFTCNFRNMKDERDPQALNNSINNSTGRWIGTNSGWGQSITVEIMIIQGSTAYMPTAVQIDGTSHTIDWEGNSAPSGTASGKDIVYFDMYKVGQYGSNQTIHVLGRRKSFGGA